MAILVWSAGFMTANVLEPDESEADILVMVSVAPNLGVGVGRDLIGNNPEVKVAVSYSRYNDFGFNSHDKSSLNK